MNKLIILVKKEINNEQKEKELEKTKSNIRGMLRLIEAKKNSIKIKEKELKKLEEEMENGDFSAITTTLHKIEAGTITMSPYFDNSFKGWDTFNSINIC